MSRAPGVQVAAETPLSVPADRSAGRLSVDVKRDLEFGPDDAAAVTALLEGRPAVAVFMSKAWLSGWFVEPPTGFEPWLVVLRDGFAIRGVVPIAVRDNLTHVVLSLLGGGAGSDRVDLVTARGFEAACADRFLTWLAETFGSRFILELRDVPADSPLWGAVHRANLERSQCLTLRPLEIHTGPYLNLVELWTSTTSMAPSAWHPPSLGKHRRWLERRCRVAVDLLDDPDDVMEAFESLTRLLHARWSHQGGSVLDDPRAQRFHRHVIPLLLREQRLRMIRLSAAGRTVGVYYGAAAGGWWGYYLAGYDRDWAGRIHLGQITLATAIDTAVQHGAAEFDFLKGADQVKYLWPVRERATLDVDVYSAGSWAQFRRATRATREAAVALAKSAYGDIHRKPA